MPRSRSCVRTPPSCRSESASHPPQPGVPTVPTGAAEKPARTTRRDARSSFATVNVVEVGGDIACILFSQSGIRHRVSGDDALWRTQPLHEIVGVIDQDAGDIGATAKLRERRSHPPALMGHPRNGVTRTTTILRYERRAAFGMRTPHRPRRLAARA